MYCAQRLYKRCDWPFKDRKPQRRWVFGIRNKVAVTARAGKFHPKIKYFCLFISYIIFLIIRCSFYHHALEGGYSQHIILLLGVFSVEEHHYALSICPRHRADFGIRWRTGKTMCTVPKELAVHKSTTAKGSHRVDSLKSAFIFKNTNTVIPVGSRKLQTFLRRLVR